MPEVRLQQREFTLELASGRGSGGIPDELQAGRQGPRGVRLRHGEAGGKVALAAAFLQGRGVAWRRPRHLERLRGQSAVRGLQAGDEPAGWVTLETQTERVVAGDRRRRRGARIAHLQGEVMHAGGVGQRDEQAAADRLDQCQDDVAAAVRGQRIDAQFVGVAERGLQQPGIDATARDVLEDLLGARLVDGDGFAHSAVDVEREAADDLTLAQRKPERALEDPSVRVVKLHRDARLRHVPVDLDIQMQRVESDGLLGAGDLQRWRLPRGPCGMRRRRQRQRWLRLGGGPEHQGDDQAEQVAVGHDAGFRSGAKMRFR